MNAFALWLGFGSTLGLWRVARNAPQRQAAAWVNTGLFVLFISLVGARLFYVSLNWSYFAAHLDEVPQVWQGGLAWPGAVTGAWLAMLYLALTSRPASRNGGQYQAVPRRGARIGSTLGWLGDRLYPLLPPIAITAWLGCWQVGVAYGPQLPPGTPWGVPSLDDSGLYNLHWPLQPAAAVFLIICFAVLEARVKPLRPVGRISGLATMILLLHLMAASLLRADPAPIWNGLRLDAWWAIALTTLFLLYLFVNSLVSRIWRRRQPYFSI